MCPPAGYPRACPWTAGSYGNTAILDLRSALLVAIVALFAAPATATDFTGTWIGAEDSRATLTITPRLDSPTYDVGIEDSDSRFHYSDLVQLGDVITGKVFYAGPGGGACGAKLPADVSFTFDGTMLVESVTWPICDSAGHPTGGTTVRTEHYRPDVTSGACETPKCVDLVSAYAKRGCGTTPKSSSYEARVLNRCRETMKVRVCFELDRSPCRCGDMDVPAGSSSEIASACGAKIDRTPYVCAVPASAGTHCLDDCAPGCRQD
jgi:hypothetical protein